MKHISFFLFLAAVVLLTGSCRKETNEPDPPPPAAASGLQATQADFYPLEVALYELVNIAAGDGIYPGTFNGGPIDVSVSAGIASFMVPMLAEGTYEFTVTIGGTTHSVPCAVRAAAIPQPADYYVTTVLAQMSMVSGQLGQMLDSLAGAPEAGPLLQDDMRFRFVADSIQSAVAGFTPEEKQVFAMVMAANEHHLYAFNVVLQDLFTAVNDMHRSVVDHETQWTVAANAFVAATLHAVARVVPVAAGLYLAIAASTTGIGLAGLAAAILLMKDLMQGAQAAAAAGARLYRVSVIVSSDIQANIQEFSAGQDILVNIEATFRTLFQGDATTPTSNFVQRFISSYEHFRSTFRSFADGLPGFLRPTFSMQGVQDMALYQSVTRRVHSAWLTVVATTSDAAVTVQRIAHPDGTTKLRFHSTADAPRNVTYTLKYEHPDLSARSTTRTALVHPESEGCDGGPPTVTDIDGNEYPVVSIGDQCWMAANLRTTRYRDGSSIPNVTGNSQWADLNTAAWCSYDNYSGYDATYGKLYNWWAAANPNICPQGWHMPTDDEWKQLETALGMPANDLNNMGYRGVAQNVGGKMKTTTLWNAPNTGATNESGFSGPSGGTRHLTDGYFVTMGGSGYWWSASESGAENAWSRWLNYYAAGIYRDNESKRFGFCLRCVRD